MLMSWENPCIHRIGRYDVAATGAGLGENAVNTLVKRRAKQGGGRPLQAIEPWELRRLLSAAIDGRMTGPPTTGAPPGTLSLDKSPPPTSPPTSLDEPPPKEEDDGPDRGNLPQN